MIKAILNAIRGYTTSFAPYERLIIAALGDKLDARLQERLRRRVAAINRVHRIDGGREVLAYQMVRGGPVFPDTTRLTAGDDIEEFARFTVSAESPMSAMTGGVLLFRGNLATIQFDQPTEHAEADEVRSVDVKLTAPERHQPEVRDEP